MMGKDPDIDPIDEEPEHISSDKIKQWDEVIVDPPVDHEYQVALKENEIYDLKCETGPLRAEIEILRAKITKAAAALVSTAAMHEKLEAVHNALHFNG